MFTKTLSGNTKKALALLGKSHILDEAYLAGGTACALQLGHRISIDLDFFITKEFDTKRFINLLKKIGKFDVDQESWGTVLGIFEEVKFSIFVYKYPVLFAYKSIFNIKVLDLRDIAAMKIDSIATRGSKRDFIDLYFICQKGITLEKALRFYERKYKTLASNIIHIQKALVYFVDAEIEEMPKMIKKAEWLVVKEFFEKEVKEIANKLIK